MSLFISFVAKWKHFFQTLDRLEEVATYAQAGIIPNNQS